MIPTYSVSMTGAIIRKIECEACATDYFYRQVAEGKSQDYVGVSSLSDKGKANAEAEAMLTRELAAIDRVVPCPSCGHVQSCMFEIARENHCWWILIGFVILGLAGVVGFLGAAYLCLIGVSEAFFMSEYQKLNWCPWIAGCSAISIAMAFAIYKIKEWVSSEYDPNSVGKEKRITLGLSIASLDAEEASSKRPSYPLVIYVLLSAAAALALPCVDAFWNNGNVTGLSIESCRDYFVFSGTLFGIAVYFDKNFRNRAE